MMRDAQAKSLTEAELTILNRVGECEGTELIRRAFLLAFPGKSYAWWARKHGFGYSLVKNVVAGHRVHGEKTEACKQALAECLGLPRWLLFVEPLDEAA